MKLSQEQKQEFIEPLWGSMTDYQKEFLESNDRTTLYHHRRTGRTYALATYAVLWMVDNIGEWIALQDHFEDTHQAKQVLLREIQKAYLRSGFCRFYNLEWLNDKVRLTDKIEILCEKGM